MVFLLFPLFLRDKKNGASRKKGCTFLKDAALESITNDRYGTTRQQTEQRGRYGNKHF